MSAFKSDNSISSKSEGLSALSDSGIKSTNSIASSCLLPIFCGKKGKGENVIIDLMTLPHLLIVGNEHSGKLEFLKSMTTDLCEKNHSETLQVELLFQNNLISESPHLPRHPDDLCAFLKNMVRERKRRYGILQRKKVKNISEFNRVENKKRMPFKVIVIDGFSEEKDKTSVEMLLDIAQKGRAAGMHLIVSIEKTPSLLLQCNFPNQIFFQPDSSPNRLFLSKTLNEKLYCVENSLYPMMSVSKGLKEYWNE